MLARDDKEVGDVAHFAYDAVQEGVGDEDDDAFERLHDLYVAQHLPLARYEHVVRLQRVLYRAEGVAAHAGGAEHDDGAFRAPALFGQRHGVEVCDDEVVVEVVLHVEQAHRTLYV